MGNRKAGYELLSSKGSIEKRRADWWEEGRI